MSGDQCNKDYYGHFPAALGLHLIRSAGLVDRLSLELEVCFQLQDAGGGVAAETGTENACGCAGSYSDHTKAGTVGVVCVRIEEVRMVEDVVCLDSDFKEAGLHSGDFETLEHREVGVEIAGARELVP